MASILNVKLIRQRFADFQSKLKVWRQRDRFRKRMKKQFKRHYQRLTENLDYQMQTFQNDGQVIHECSQLYNDFQDHARKCYKNQKILNNFLAGLPEVAQSIDPDDLSRLILKAESAHNEVRDLYNSFVSVVKAECVMNVHFFAFTSLPELIVRKNYSRKQFEQLTKLLVAVKEEYLALRAKEEENVDDQKKDKNHHLQPKTDPKIITEEDLVEISLLDDFLVAY